MKLANQRAVAIGVVASVVAGFGLMALAGSVFWIYAGAAVGITLALGLRRKQKSDD